jgi:hypothetical protein
MSATEVHVDRLFGAELQFRLASAVRSAEQLERARVNDTEGTRELEQVDIVRDEGDPKHAGRRESADIQG